jgi:hypothetical protein
MVYGVSGASGASGVSNEFVIFGYAMKVVMNHEGLMDSAQSARPFHGRYGLR